MEHVLHIFGGGCGEHLLVPYLIGGTVSTAGVVGYIKKKVRALK